MTANIMEIQQVGGPNDGQIVEVQVDEHGRPPELYTCDRVTPYNWTIDPTTQLGNDVATTFLELDVRIEDDGIRYVYVFKGEQLHGLAA
jgi:hypothetical protein